MGIQITTTISSVKIGYMISKGGEVEEAPISSEKSRRS